MVYDIDLFLIEYKRGQGLTGGSLTPGFSPYRGPTFAGFWERLRDAWAVFTKKAFAVRMNDEWEPTLTFGRYWEGKRNSIAADRAETPQDPDAYLMECVRKHPDIFKADIENLKENYDLLLQEVDKWPLRHRIEGIYNTVWMSEKEILDYMGKVAGFLEADGE